MSRDEIVAFAERQRGPYADSLVRDMMLTSEEAERKATEDYRDLAAGTAADGHLLFVAENENDERVGDL
jgi:hypothetical protein